MSLRSIVSDLQKRIGERGITWEEERLVHEGIAFSDGMEKLHLEIIQMGKKAGHPHPSPHLSVTGYARMPEMAEAFMEGILGMAKSLPFHRGTARAEYNVSWHLGDFQEVKSLASLYSGEVGIISRIHTVDPQKVLSQNRPKRHNFMATTTQSKLSLKADGLYRAEFLGIADMVNADQALLHLSEHDVKDLEDGALFTAFEEAAQKLAAKAGRQFRLISAESDGSNVPNAAVGRIANIYIPRRHVEMVSRALGTKPMVNADEGQTTRVEEFVKKYGLRQFWKGERVTDLKRLAETVPRLNFGLLYDHPLITYGQAKDLLGNEISMISGAYDNRLQLGADPEDARRHALFTLARELLGPDALAMALMPASDYARFLQSMGYEAAAVREESGDLAKERHLLEFLRQSFHSNPGKLAMAYRELYKNKGPEMAIYGKRMADASLIRWLHLPEGSKLNYFGIEENAGSECPYENSFMMGIDHQLGRIHFSFTTSIDSPRLLPLQEYACEEIGIEFK